MAFLPVAPVQRHLTPSLTSSFTSSHPTHRRRPSSRILPQMTAIRPLPDPSNQKSSEIRVATARAITPARRPHPDLYQEQQLPSQRRTDLMAPQRSGIFALLPYVAASSVALALAWLAKKRLVARQDLLVEEFGDVLVLYGSTPDQKREIASEYKRKLGPGILRGRMFASYLRALVAEKSVVPETIQDVNIIKRLLRISDGKAVNMINELGTKMQDAPSLLGKLLFIADRILPPEHVQKLALVALFPYSATTVADLQRNMLERCYREHVTQELDLHNIAEPPLAAAAALRLDAGEAKTLFDGVVLARIKQRELEEAAEAAAEAEEGAKPEHAELDYPARSGEPAKADVHAYQCSDCGYTLFPAAGREFKFYGADFACPACGAPKDKFVDLNADE